MRLTDAWLAFPFLILAIGLVTILGPSLTNATLAIGLGATPTYIRLTRGLVLSTKQEDYVQGAQALGAGDLRLMGRHILPNIISAILVQATVAIPTAIIAEAVLSFLGPRRAAARPFVGHDAQCRPAIPRAGSLDGHLAGAGDLSARPLL